METELKSGGSWRIIRRVILVIFDIFAVDISYYGALVIRFYVSGAFHVSTTKYPGMFLKFAPWYTICCIVVFALFKLYDGVWRYAGLNDFNRILYANIITFIIQMLGTLLFVGRMPLTYYALGAIIQFLLILLSRFSMRIYKDERTLLSQKNTGINIMVVGVGKTADMVLNQLKGDDNTIWQPVCVLDYKNEQTGRTIDGLPIIGGVEGINDAIKTYGVKSVIIADTLMPFDVRKNIRQRCSELDIDVQDYSGFYQTVVTGVDLKNFLQVVNGSVEIKMEDISQRFENGEEAALTISQGYVVKSVKSLDGILEVEIKKERIIPQMPDESWAKNEEDISFF